MRLQVLRRAMFELLDDAPAIDAEVGPELADAIQRAANELGFAELMLRKADAPRTAFA